MMAGHSSLVAPLHSHLAAHSQSLVLCAQAFKHVTPVDSLSYFPAVVTKGAYEKRVYFASWFQRNKSTSWLRGVEADSRQQVWQLSRTPRGQLLTTRMKQREQSEIGVRL